MNESATYSVVLSGDLKSGFEADAVVDAFARLFKLPPEKAGAIIGRRFVLKKEVGLEVAKTYQEKLAAIGLEVKLKRLGGIDELALEPVQEPESQDGEQAELLRANEMICPKCELRQARAEECSGCGVYVDRVPKNVIATGAAAGNPATPAAAASNLAEAVESGDAAVGMRWVIAPAVAAVLGALVWYMVAASLGYEFGAIAWLIGGAVGFAAVSSGARGHAIGVICGLLVLVSICGGKYLTISKEQSELAEVLSTSLEYEGLDLREIYDEEIADARDFMKIREDDAGLRRFMVSHEYSEYAEASQVTDEEIAIFREYTQPRLEDIDLNRPSFEEWQQYSLRGAIEDLPTFDLMVESLDWKDMLFLLFGIGTAFQLASRGRTTGA